MRIGAWAASAMLLLSLGLWLTPRAFAASRLHGAVGDPESYCPGGASGIDVAYDERTQRIYCETTGENGPSRWLQDDMSRLFHDTGAALLLFASLAVWVALLFATSRAKRRARGDRPARGSHR